MMPALTMRCGRLFVVPLLLALAGAARAEETRMVPVTVDGERVRLEMRIHAPRTDRPVPTLVFNHLYPAGHGFSRDERGRYHEPSAKLARQRALELLAQPLRR